MIIQIQITIQQIKLLQIIIIKTIGPQHIQLQIIIFTKIINAQQNRFTQIKTITIQQIGITENDRQIKQQLINNK